MTTQTTNGRADSGADTITISRKVFVDLLDAHYELFEFAKTYGPSSRAHWEDWSGYFELSHKAQRKAEKALKEAKTRAA